jgi:cob(I)alamin adenosyltransferase
LKIYTKTGDQGETGLFAGPRVPKNHPRVAAYGDVDELNAALGVAVAEKPPAKMRDLLAGIQHDLFSVGAELATPDPARQDNRVSEARIDDLEAAIDEWETALPALKEFILPGGGRLGAALHLARTVCRRAERSVVALAAGETSFDLRPLRYLNRLSDLLFVLARAANHQAGLGDIPWRKPGG